MTELQKSANEWATGIFAFLQKLGFKHNLGASIQGYTLLPGLIIISAGSPLLSADLIFLADGRGPATIY